MIDEFATTELRNATDDPAGGVVLPGVHRDIARARGLAGAAIGLSAKFGVAVWTPLSTTTSITV